MGSLGQVVLDQCIIHGFGYLGSRITGVIEGTRRVQKTWKSVDEVPFRIVAIVERDPGRLQMAQTSHPDIPCFADIEEALEVFAGPTTFIKDFTSPIGRARLLAAARRVGVPVLLEKPLSSPGVEVSLAGRESEASVSMSEAFNPVVRALANKLAADASEIRSFSFVRVNSVSLERLRNPNARRDIIGGAFVDKLSHDLHLLISGAILGPTDVEFGTPQIQEIAYDLLAKNDGTRGLSFSSLDGVPLPPKEAAAPNSDASEMMVDFTMPMQLDGRSVPTRWIASWCGVPDNLASRLGIPDAYVEAARVISAGDPNAVGRAAYPRSNLKLLVCEYVNSAGEEAQLICNLQARGAVTAWLIELRNGAEYRLPVKYCVSIVESMNSFSQYFRTGGYLDLEGIEKADRAALEIRSRFPHPLKDELRIERSLAILDRNHGGRFEYGESQCSCIKGPYEF
ncbi:hypothetical protein EYZ11_000322 [Aspergillus tanneri]|uniref:Uncharacterized protein n=1 Tax=Aspergillus tanneri TaxID=1220188 RepID=A0A4V3UQR8_9EURO|nr:uncharacterized protein ATNIH1004_004295 [Aspergillus tanneri]KAA8648410.1 hypothetical protein ATNIH1004_004295 [Aspergillus tanneri]THD00131.1 hypothetical protein EYZ11_000322 [Aspergillus tanneri]